ncbi:uncharacterized protein [Ptychodera flava]|uniref:uncharacterized protein n=1 Tax=Ptychodera flava TaxID=63121 RepID=UPI003969C727
MAVNMSMPVTTTTITTITTTVSTSTFASPRKPDTDESYQPQSSKTNIIKLSPRKDNPPQESPRSDETQSHLSETAKKPEEGAVGVEVDDAESCTSGSQTSNPRCLNEEKDVSPAGSDILTPSRKSAFTLVQPRPKVPAVQNSADKVPKTRPVVTLPLKSSNAVNGSSTVQGEKNAYFAPVRKEYTLACSFPQDELRKEISQALATSSIRPQNEAFIMGLDTSQSLMNSVEIESPYRETEQTSSNRPVFMSKKNSALERAKDLMLSAHEEQIIEMGQLSEKEYKLIQEVKDGDRDFTYFVEKLDDLLYSKIRCIETLRSQLESFSQSTTPRKS